MAIFQYIEKLLKHGLLANTNKQTTITISYLLTRIKISDDEESDYGVV